MKARYGMDNMHTTTNTSTVRRGRILKSAQLRQLRSRLMPQKTSRYSRRRLATAIGVLGALALSACSPLNLRTTLTRAGAQGSDRTGQAVAMSNDGTTMVVGSPYVAVRGTAEAGVVTVYGRDAAALEWTKVTEI
ncbi:MAG: hypothetical protein RJB08_639, partial [Actinomycetota bacterium]